jgi:hypothetical protein
MPAQKSAAPASGEFQRPMGTKLPRLVFDTAALRCVSAMASEPGAAGWLDYTPAWLKRIIGKNYEKKLPTAGLLA